ncbi:MAG: hypothetical protein M2R45_02233 [Verrucomicrobia subdivision 3 bacterium]|nr:hypothetical protein [Limisphaerales bacterium]MCS1413982.1 hypothetical protein [Limisphaerales bacterium]
MGWYFKITFRHDFWFWGSKLREAGAGYLASISHADA